MSSRRNIAENPFYVLGLLPACTRMEIEREGHKLLSMLELRLSGAETYATPFGPEPRTPELVRAAMAQLRDPQKRLTHELRARLAPSVSNEIAEDKPEASGAQPWTDALAVLGWRPR